MRNTLQKTLSLGFSGLLALGIGIAHAADAAPQRVPNVLHEMVPHVILPETIQYNKTAKNMPGNGYSSVHSPFVAAYVAAPSYQVPHTTEFKSVGQSVYPISPPQLPKPIAQQESEVEKPILQNEAMNESEPTTEPIRLASAAEDTVPTLPAPTPVVAQTGIFCQHPAEPPSAWAFSSPLFKVASVPAGWGGGQMGSINHNGFKSSTQQVNFQPVGMGNGAESAAPGTVPPGIPYSTFQMERPAEQNPGPQAQILPNGMILLTLPTDHNNCGLIRCRANHQPRTLLLPPAPGYCMPQTVPQGPLTPTVPETSMMMPQNFGTPMSTPMSMTAPITAMTPMGPAIIGYRQVPMMPMMNPMAMNPMAMNPMAMMNPAANPQVSPIQQVNITSTQMNPAQMNPTLASPMASPFPASTAPKTANEAANGAVPTMPTLGSTTTTEQEGAAETEQSAPASQMVMVATPYGYYAMQASADMTAQLAQMQSAQMQPQMMTQTNPYVGVCATPFGYVALNPSGMVPSMQPNGAFGMPMMNTPYNSMGMMNMSDMLQIMTFLNNNKPQRRARLMERIAERRENRKTSVSNDPFAQLMQAWTTPYVSQDTSLRMPSRNAYPFGYFGVQAAPKETANYGGYHNLYFGSTSYPGLY